MIHSKKLTSLALCLMFALGISWRKHMGQGAMLAFTMAGVATTIRGWLLQSSVRPLLALPSTCPALMAWCNLARFISIRHLQR